MNTKWNADGLVVYRGKGASQKTAKMAADKYASQFNEVCLDSFEIALSALQELHTALNDGPWAPSVVLSRTPAPPACRMDFRDVGKACAGCGNCKDRTYLALHKFIPKVNSSSTPERVVIFKGRFDTPRAAVKAASEFLLPKTHDALVEQLRAAAAKL